MTVSDPLRVPVTREHDLDDGAGNRLRVREWGPLDGDVVVFHHEIRGCGLSVPGGWSTPDALGIRVITVERPGYGCSTGTPGRRVVDAAGWTRRVADRLGLDEFALLGRSGGAPHAAAAAAVLGERVRRLCLTSGLGPDELPGFDPAAGMVAAQRHEIACARVGETSLRTFIDEQPSPSSPEGLDPFSPSDVEVLGRGDVRIEDQARHRESLRQGTDGWVHDDLALFHHPWGFDLAAITAPTLLLYGLDDVHVPASHGDAYRRALGHGQLVKIPDAGHLLRDYEPDVLRWLVSDDPGPARLSM